MTKGAIVNFSKGLGQALAERGIRVNTVAPGPIWTPLIPATMPSEKVEKFGERRPPRAGGAACRAGARVRVLRLAGVQLRHGAGAGRDRGFTPGLTLAAPNDQGSFRDHGKP